MPRYMRSPRFSTYMHAASPPSTPSTTKNVPVLCRWEISAFVVRSRSTNARSIAKARLRRSTRRGTSSALAVRIEIVDAMNSRSSREPTELLPLA